MEKFKKCDRIRVYPFRGNIMHKKFGVSATIVLILLLIVTVNALASSIIHFTPDFASEFPDTASYNNVRNSLTDYYRNALKLQNTIPALSVISTQSIFNEEIKNVAFGVNLHIAFLGSYNPEKSEYRDDTAYGQSPLINSFFIGFSLSKKLNMYLNYNIVCRVFSTTLLWKFYEHSSGDIEIVDYGYGVTGKKKVSPRLSKLFLSSTISFGFPSINSIDKKFGGLFSGFTPDNSHVKTVLGKPIINHYESRFFLIDFSFRYHLRYKFFNLYAAAGFAFHAFYVQENYSQNINVDYWGYGSATGIETNASILNEEKAVYIIPHADAGFAFTFIDWFKIGVMFNIAYAHSIKRIIFSITAGILFNF